MEEVLKTEFVFLLEIIEAIKTEWPAENPLWVRISATDWTEDGWNEKDSVKLSLILKDKGIDLMDCSSGGNVAHVKIPVGPGYQVPFSEKIKTETGMLTGSVGMITNAKQAEEILEKKQADLIIIARQSLRDTYFPLHAAKELNDDIDYPKQYERAKI